MSAPATGDACPEGLPATPDFGVWPIGHRIEAAGVDGRLVRVRWDDGRESRFHFRWLRDIYDGIQTFFELANDPALRAVFPIHAGDLLAFDNRRVLHARTAFDASSGRRHLVGCYLDRDELLSRLRVLARACHQ